MRYKAIMAGAALVMATPAIGEDWDFVLINNSGKEIKTIEVSVSGAASWVPNRVEEGTKARPVKAGARTTVHFDKTGCRYDLKATFADDTVEIWPGINVCDNSYVTVRYAKGKPAMASN